MHANGSTNGAIKVPPPRYVPGQDAFLINGRSVPRHALVSQTERMIDELVEAQQEDREPHPRAMVWLQTLGLTSWPKVERWLREVRPRLLAPEDPSHVVHCRVCGRPLTAPESKARGVGPTCAQKNQK
jgi:hypothetical protein